MLCARCLVACLAVFVTAVTGATSAYAERVDHTGALSEVPLPGGLAASLAVVDDRVAPDRSQFLFEFIRRTYQAAAGAKHEQREAALRALLVHLDLAARTGGGTAPETLPLPLTVPLWIDVVFGGRSSPKTLLADIVRTRGPALLYNALLSLDEETRAWFATKPDLLREIVAQHSAGFLVAAPGLRISSGALRVPGGEPARPGWEAVVGRHVTQPDEFVRALVSDRERRLPYYFSAMARLTPAELDYALNLRARDADARADAIRRMHGVFERIAPGWRIEERTFWRPASDPALLVSELAIAAGGQPAVPGTRRFWAAAFDDSDGRSARDENPRALTEGSPVDFVRLCEQIFSGDQRRRHPSVLFASRVVPRITIDNAVDALESVRAVWRYPALIATLERAKVRDVSVLAAAARRAASLSSIEDEQRASRSLAQFQGALAILARAAPRGGVPPEKTSELVRSLSAVEIGVRGDYEGRLVRWFDELFRHAPAMDEPADEGAGQVERAVIQILAGAPARDARFVDWEGTRYRVDLRRAEALRLVRLLGDEPRPYLSSARALVDVADTLASTRLTREALARQKETLEEIADSVGGDAGAALHRTARQLDLRGAPRIASGLLLTSDTLFAQGLLEFVYAIALGNPDRTAIIASDAAGRHDFGLGLGAIRRQAPWRIPAGGTGLEREWRVTGSLLGLDVKLAEFSLVAVSSKPPLRRPTIMDEDRRVFIEAVALVEPASLTDDDRAAIVAAIDAGRARVASVRTAADAMAVADAIRLSAAQRSLLAWTAEHQPDALASFLSYGELLSLGLSNTPRVSTLQAWGAPAEPRVGCLCLQLLDGSPFESVEGRWNAGILASAFPDLNLRVAELLAELRMPAVLLPSVLAAAMLDFINTAECRDGDDRRGLVDFVRHLRTDRVEQYLALLTTDGPLVPVSEDSSEVVR